MKPGYSRATVQDNIASLQREGYELREAILIAFTQARASFFKAHPQGALPEWLAWPKGKRLAQHYHEGKPIDPARSNPVRKLRKKPRVTAAAQMDDPDIRKAAALFTRFTGDEKPQILRVKTSKLPKKYLAIGYLDGVLYSTVRDGNLEKYIHRFRRNCRPLLLVTPDGKQLRLIGGSFDFTERGIVDRS